MGLPRKRNLSVLAHQLRVSATREEKKLWRDFLSTYPIPFRQQKVIGVYIVDFFCNKVRLSIELDGSQHYEETGRTRDMYRTRYLELLEIKELRFSNYDIWFNFESVCETIHNEVTDRRNDLVTQSLDRVKDKR
ncbi:endonuclease domain-containing protein [Raoultibacter phocaeensis]|uniref:endonuclease domain-containing protein n=1 Tax=Raoultibacter phocaeensis TaxID=2479841 RepID=UPI00111A594F|nr:endonuclease domain-containing protein [Raoultibacter phocaeensis]